MIETIKKKTSFKQSDLLNIAVNHDDLWHRISTGNSRSSDIDRLLNKIQSILTSSEELDIFSCELSFEVVIIPRILNIAEDLRTKKSITQIKQR